jgi:hypothetical protein
MCDPSTSLYADRQAQGKLPRNAKINEEHGPRPEIGSGINVAPADEQGAADW